MTYFLLTVNIVLMSIGQLFFKQSAIFINNNSFNFIQRYLYNPWFYGACFFFGIATLTWVQILTNMKISIAYPVLSISYILTALGAYFIFGERMAPINIIGIFLVMSGVTLISLK